MGRQMDIRGRWYLVLFLILCLPIFGMNAHDQQIHNVLDPDENQDAATKKYVDDNISGPSGIHNWLSSAHGDTENATPPAEGSIVRGNASLKWEELTGGTALGGAATHYFGWSGSTSGYRTLAQIAVEIDSLLDHGSFAGLDDPDHNASYFTETEMAATSSPSGASLIGIEDAMSLYIATDVEAALEEVKDLVTVVVYSADSIVTTPGGLTVGSVSDIQTINDGNVYTITETNGGPNPNFTTVITYTSVGTGHEANKIQLHYSYDGSIGHTINLEIENSPYNDSVWDSVDTLVQTSGTLIFLDVDIPGTITDYNNSGTTKIRIIHNNNGTNTHDFVIDYAVILDDPAGMGGITDHGQLSGLADDDHTQYLLAGGTRELTANWDAGSFAITIGTTTIQDEEVDPTGSSPFDAGQITTTNDYMHYKIPANNFCEADGTFPTFGTPITGDYIAIEGSGVVRMAIFGNLPIFHMEDINAEANKGHWFSLIADNEFRWHIANDNGSIKLTPFIMQMSDGSFAFLDISADDIEIQDAGFIGSDTTPEAIQIDADGDVILVKDLFIGGEFSDGTLSIINGVITEIVHLAGDDLDIVGGTGAWTTSGPLSAGATTVTSLTDGTLSITGGSITDIVSLAGDDLDISAGTGDYTSTGDGTFNHLGLGGASPDAGIGLRHTETFTVNGIGISETIFIDPSAGEISGTALIFAANATGDTSNGINQLRGAVGQAGALPGSLYNGIIAELVGVEGNILLFGSPTPPFQFPTAINAYNFKGTQHNAAVFAVIENSYGLFLPDITVGTVSNHAIKTGAGDHAFGGASDKLGFYAKDPVALQTGVAVDVGELHTALVNLGLITGP